MKLKTSLVALLYFVCTYVVHGQNELFSLTIDGNKVSKVEMLSNFPNSGYIQDFEYYGNDKILISNRLHNKNYELILLDKKTSTYKVLTDQNNDLLSPKKYMSNTISFLNVQSKTLESLKLNNDQPTKQIMTFQSNPESYLQLTSTASALVTKENNGIYKLNIINTRAKSTKTIATQVLDILKKNRLNELLFIVKVENTYSIMKYNMNNGMIKSVAELPAGVRNFDLFGSSETIICTKNNEFWQYNTTSSSWSRWINLDNLNIGKIDKIFNVGNEIYFTSH